MKLDPRALVQFTAIAEEASITRAAQRLHVAQPWLSARLRKFEDQLGFALFERSTRSIRLTDQGSALLPLARALTASLKDVEALASQLQREGSKRFRIGAPPYSAQIGRRRELVTLLQRRHPELGLELEPGWSPVLLDRLREGDLEATFALGEISGDGLEAIRLDEIELSLTLRVEHPLAHHEIVTLDMLEGQRIGVFQRGLHPQSFDALHGALAEAGALLVQLVDKDDAMLLAAAPDALMMANLRLEKTPHKDNGLVTRLLQPRQSVPFSLVRRKGHASPEMQSLWDLAKGGPAGSIGAPAPMVVAEEGLEPPTPGL